VSEALALLAGAYALVELASRGAVTRFVWHLAARAVAALDLASMELRGSCHKCGECCRQIVGDPPRFVKDTMLLRLFVAYHRAMHRFEVTGRGPDGEVVFACAHVRQDGRCGIYRRRPLLCRNFPTRPFFEPPGILPGCGFAMAPRLVAEMRRRPSLPVVNPGVTVHHPSRERRGLDQREDFEWLDDTASGRGATS